MINRITDRGRLILVLVGMLLLGIGMAFSFVSDGPWTSFLTGVGGGIVGAGALTFVIARISPAYAREQERLKHDERADQIRGQAAHLTIFIMAILMAAAILVSLYLERETVSSVISCILLTMTSLFILLNIYLNRRG
ncbi:MAG: DUF2178 domain-containing protein [Coriobacteriales bacterium]|jgi:drug/metabolite transporter (DMT)-like permease|nr:DUF2178 domain-containing protein [Coriobacteriales bacterium]